MQYLTQTCLLVLGNHPGCCLNSTCAPPVHRSSLLEPDKWSQRGSASEYTIGARHGLGSWGCGLPVLTGHSRYRAQWTGDVEMCCFHLHDYQRNQSVSLSKWDEQKTVKEAHSYSRQLRGFSVSSPLPSLWFLNLWVTPYRPTSCFLMNHLWVSIITVSSLFQLMTVAHGHAYYLVSFYGHQSDTITPTCCFMFLQLVTCDSQWTTECY